MIQVKNLQSLQSIVNTYVFEAKLNTLLVISFDDSETLDQLKDWFNECKTFAHIDGHPLFGHERMIIGNDIVLIKDHPEQLDAVWTPSRYKEGITKAVVYHRYVDQYDEQNLRYCQRLMEVKELPVICLVDEVEDELNQLDRRTGFEVVSFKTDWDVKAEKLCSNLKKMRKIIPDYQASSEEIWAERLIDRKRIEAGLTPDEEQEYLERATKLAEKYQTIQYDLGRFYLKKKDYETAFSWLHKACGDVFHMRLSEAYITLGDCYRDGEGVDKDLDKALEYYNDAKRYASNRAKKKIAEKRIADLTSK